MLSVEQAESRVTELQQEAAKLEASLLELEREQGEHNKQLDAAYVLSERTPTPQNQREANQLEAHANLLRNQVRRKSVALEACKADLVEAVAILQRAQLAAAVVTFEAYAAEMADICTQLETNVNQPELWQRMTAIFHQGNALYRQLQPIENGHIHARTIFIDPGIVLERTLHIIRARLSQTFDSSQRIKSDITTIAEAAELERVQKALTFERRRHIDTFTQATEPIEAVAVLA